MKLKLKAREELYEAISEEPSREEEKAVKYG